MHPLEERYKYTTQIRTYTGAGEEKNTEAMVFTVNVSADLFGSKENVALDFPTRPSMHELAAYVLWSPLGPPLQNKSTKSLFDIEYKPFYLNRCTVIANTTINLT